MNEVPRPACALICAVKRDKRAARGVVSRALSKALPKGSFHYISESEIRSYGSRDARYQFDCTDSQFAAFEKALAEESNAAGFDIIPADCYHD